MSAGIWLKVRTDRPKPASTTTAFVSLKDKGLHRPTPFSFFQKPLGNTQIRLLELLPGSIGHQLSGHLRVFDLDTAPSYSALSYTWGNPEAKDVIMIGDRVDRPHSIVGNLSIALKHLWQPNSSRMIWVDALCINQNDIDERSHQVQIMGTIFGSASEVLIWLGRKTAHSEYGMMILQHLASGRGFEENSPWETLPPELVRRGLQDTLNREWFRRIWTVQEAALSSQSTTMMCENDVVTWQADPASVLNFVRGLKFAAVSASWAEIGLAGSEGLRLQGVDLDDIINVLEQQLQQIRRRRDRTNVMREPDLLDLTYSFKDRLSTDPRDKVFAILDLALIGGLSGASGATQMRPDYSKPLNVVYDDFRRLLRQSIQSRLFIDPSNAYTALQETRPATSIC